MWGIYLKSEASFWTAGGIDLYNGKWFASLLIANHQGRNSLQELDF